MRCPCGNDQTTFDPSCRVCGGTGNAPSLGEQPAPRAVLSAAERQRTDPIEPGQVWVQVGDGVRTRDVSLTVVELLKSRWVALTSPSGKRVTVHEKTLRSSMYRYVPQDTFQYPVTKTGRVVWRGWSFDQLLEAVRAGIPGAERAASRRAAGMFTHTETLKALAAVAKARQECTQRKKDLRQATRETH